MKNLFILSVLGVVSSAALAAGATTKYNTAPAPALTSDTGVYIEGLVGYNRYVFDSALGTPDTVAATNWHNGSGNWTLGADIGYQFQRYLSAELGGIYTFYGALEPQDKSPGAPGSLKLQPSYAYLAGKFSMPVYNNFSVFAKLGAGYQKIYITTNGAEFLGSGVTSESNWGPMLGAGIAYNFTPAFYVSGEWLYFTNSVGLGPNGSISTKTPNIFLLGVGYKFAM